MPLSGLRLAALTAALFGVQLAWALELAFGTPFLLGLGLSKQATALVWLAGPLSGLVVQPLIGAISDASTSRYGRRRPFIVAGSALVIVAISAIAMCRPLGGSTTSGSASDAGNGASSMSVAIAVFGFYVLDFAINGVMAACRALIVDTAPGMQQSAASAAASAMVCLGNVVGYAAGFVDWAAVLFGRSTGNSSPADDHDIQFRAVAAVAAVVLAISVSITCASIHEPPAGGCNSTSSSSRRRQRAGDHDGQALSALDRAVETIVAPLVAIVRAARVLPPTVRTVCLVQLCAWTGWFPFLFYATTYVAHPFEGPGAASAARMGSLGYLGFSVLSLTVSLGLPHAAARWQLSIPIVWAAGQVSLAMVMFATLFVTTGTGAAALVAMCGVSWAIGLWAPMSLIGAALADDCAGSEVGEYPDAVDGYASVAVEEVGQQLHRSRDRLHPHDRRQDKRAYLPVVTHERDGAQRATASSTPNISVSNFSELGDDTPTLIVIVDESDGIDHHHHHHRPAGAAAALLSPPSDGGSTGAATAAASPGIVLGIHNIAIVAPQLVVSLLAAVLFAILPDGRGEPMVPGAVDDAIGWLFRVGGVSALLAAVFISRGFSFNHQGA
ncbi:major facilitator superfamily domain-containing protein [Blastocladiella britannica]|nr:major facilitator superfamily domain-containing protein [Blastocladiella britannica]